MTMLLAVYNFSFNPAALVFIGFALTLHLWRLWRFTVRVYFRPDDPKELPYWIPFIGHFFSFFGNSHGLIEKGLDYTKRTNEPFALKIGPETIYVITSPQDVAEAFKRVDSLGWEGHLNDIFKNFGMSPESLRISWMKPTLADYGPDNSVNPTLLPLIRLIENIYAKQLLPGIHMDEMSESWVKSLEATLRWPTMDYCVVKTHSTSINENRKTISLKRLCQHTMLEAGMYSFFGEKIKELDPTFIQTMLAFNENAWMLFYGLPHLFASKVLTPQRKLRETFEKFASLPESARADQSWGVQQLLVAQEAMGVDLESKACMLLLILWAANSNVNNIAFWFLAYIISDTNLYSAVQREIDAAWTSNDNLDIKSLCTNSPVLTSLFHECLRTKAGAMMGRKVLKPVRIGTKWLQPGAQVLIPSRQLHFNEKVWGADVGEFDAGRFMEGAEGGAEGGKGMEVGQKGKGGKKGGGMEKHSSFRPFGGGVSLCPGRKISKVKVFALVGVLLRRFDVQLSGEGGRKQEFPTIDLTTPALGVTGPAKGMDLWLDIKPRLRF